MANEAKLLKGLKEHLQPGEEAVRGVAGAYETKILGQDNVRNGILVATDRRIVFYAKKLTGYDLESFPFGNISSLEMGKNMMGHHVRFFASGNEVRIKWIKDAAGLEKFMAHVRDHMAGAPATSGGTAGESAIDKLKKLAELRDAGIVDEAEFAAKKAQLLGEI